jgi:hypothetical protein
MTWPAPYTTYGTLLSITATDPTLGAFAVQYYAGRELHQTLDQIDSPAQEPQLQRSGNGNLINFTRPQFQKLRSVVTLNSLRPPVLNDSWVGQTVVVNCAIYRWYASGQSPDRTVVPGTTPVGPDPDGNYGYLPQLNMTVKSFSCDYDEWKHFYRSRIVMEES